jgi:hypothetical protein
MNLHSIVRPAITAINPDTQVSWKQSTGSTTNTDGSLTPTYTTVSAPMQVQGVSGRMLQQLQNLNITGVLRHVYSYGDAQGVARPSFEGGDLISFAQQYGGTPQVWKVVQTLETWSDAVANGWSGAIVQLQTDITAAVA